MKLTLEIRMSNSEGALERILGKLRQRSFLLCALAANWTADRSLMDVRITLEGGRAAEPTIRQIGKLYDVKQVRVHHVEAEQNHGCLQFQQEQQFEACLPL